MTDTTTPPPPPPVFQPNLDLTTMPPPFQYFSTEPTITKHEYDQQGCSKRQILAGIGVTARVLGVFLGLFNQGKIANIRLQLGDLNANQNMLVHISHTHDQQIHLLLSG